MCHAQTFAKDSASADSAVVDKLAWLHMLLHLTVVAAVGNEWLNIDTMGDDQVRGFLEDIILVLFADLTHVVC